MAQFNERQVNVDVQELRAALSEAQTALNLLIDRINGCGNC